MRATFGGRQASNQRAVDQATRDSHAIQQHVSLRSPQNVE